MDINFTFSPYTRAERNIEIPYRYDVGEMYMLLLIQKAKWNNVVEILVIWDIKCKIALISGHGSL